MLKIGSSVRALMCLHSGPSCCVAESRKLRIAEWRIEIPQWLEEIHRRL
jgi:hypothetical protein